MLNTVVGGKYVKSEYPLHKHDKYEIIYYTSGKGKTLINGKEIEVFKGDIIIMPPSVMHGTISLDNCGHLSVRGELGNILQTQEPLFIKDNDKEEGRTLINLMFLNRYGNEEYFNSLCLSYVHFVLQNLKLENDIDKSVNKIKEEIILRFYDLSFSVNKVLNESGYSEDYVRAHFKKITKKTPVEFLNEIRIRFAEDLIKTYKNVLTLSEISYKCGFVDYIYFSRKFKEINGVSPVLYRKKVLEEGNIT